MEFSRLVVPKLPRTNTENHQKKESIFWKSYKVCRFLDTYVAASDSFKTDTWCWLDTVPHLCQILCSRNAFSLFTLFAASIPCHFGYTASDLLAQDQQGRQNYL